MIFLKTYSIKISSTSFVNALLFVCFVFKLNAQSTPTCINIGANRIAFSKDSSSFLKFYKKLDELKSGKIDRVNIVHFGGSHLQAGALTEILMNGFQSLTKTEGGGTFIFPFSIVKTNGPPFFKSFSSSKWRRCRCALAKEMCDNLGMAGMGAITNDSLVTFGFKLLPNNHHKFFNSIKVYHNFNSSFELSLNSNQIQFTRNDHKKKGYTEFQFESYLDSISFSLLRKDTVEKDFLLRGFSIENNKLGIYFATMGVNGARSNSFLACTEFVNELKSITPDLVILSLGVNDTQGNGFTKNGFIAQYDSMLALIKKASPHTAFLITTTTDNYIKRKTPNKRSIIAQEAAYELMAKHNIAVYDMFAVMGGYKSIYKWYKAGYANKDKVHFLIKGYHLVGQLMFDAIEQSYLNSSKLKPLNK